MERLRTKFVATLAVGGLALAGCGNEERTNAFQPNEVESEIRDLQQGETLYENGMRKTRYVSDVLNGVIQLCQEGRLVEYSAIEQEFKNAEDLNIRERTFKKPAQDCEDGKLSQGEPKVKPNNTQTK